MAGTNCPEVGTVQKFGFTEGEETEINHDCYLQKSFHKDSICLPLYAIVDRIRSFKVLDEHFHVPYRDRFEEGEFRKRVQFMYGGKLEHIKFRYTGPSIEAVLDRLPTAEVIEADGDGWIIRAEVFGKGIEMWLMSQGNYIEKID